MEFVKKHFVVVLAFALPIVLIFGIAASSYIPSALLSTEYNFVYATCDEGSNYYRYGCGGYLNSLYTVEGGTLILNEIDEKQDFNFNERPDREENYEIRLFLHNTESNESREITLSEAQQFDLNPLITSPDGVSVQNSYDQGTDFFFVFNGSSRYGYYLTKGSKRKKINLVNEDGRYYYQDGFKFIGWVKR